MKNKGTTGPILFPLKPGLPLNRQLSNEFVISLLIALLMANASLFSLLERALIYPADELAAAFLTNDLLNLVIGLPALLGAIWLTRRGNLTGLLLWPAALFYVLYNYTAYLFGMPFTPLFLPNLVLVGLSLYALIGLFTAIQSQPIAGQLAAKAPDKFAGAILVILGLGFGLRAVGVIWPMLAGKSPMDTIAIATPIADLVLVPLLLAGGILLWRRRPSGYLYGSVALFLTSLLFIGLILFLVFKPLLTTAEFALVDLIVIAVMGLPCFIPTGIFLRRLAAQKENP